MKINLHIIAICSGLALCLSCLLSACQQQQLTDNSNDQLSFSSDTVSFDTIFTAAGTSTQCVMIRNNNANAIRIQRIWWQKGSKFFANIDGENNPQQWQDIDINGGDSIYVFLRAQIDPYGDNTHPIEYDTLFFETHNNPHRVQYIAVSAFGMDIERIHPQGICPDFHFTSDKPYLLYDTLIVSGTLTIDAGTTIYMRPNAAVIALGNVTAIGTQEQPVRLMGDRTDYIFPQVPYRMASGQWGGLYLIRYDSLCAGQQICYDLQHIDLLSGQVGLFCYGDSKDHRALLKLACARVHNMSAYGIVLENTDAQIANTEISNCAAYGLYLCGGQHRIEHASVANYFGYPYTTLNIHNTPRQDVAAVYVLASSADMASSESSFYNSIITGAVHPSLVIDSIPESGYKGRIAGCYLRCDSDSICQYTWADHNSFAHEQDSVFVNTFYRYGEYHYYDFRLHELSPARAIGLPLDSLMLDVKTDLMGFTRLTNQPDAGCYTYQ